MMGPYRSEGWGQFCYHCANRIRIVWSNDMTNPHFGVEQMVHLCEPCWQECVVDGRSLPRYFAWEGVW